MGNSLRARLHLNKKDDRPTRADKGTPMTENPNSGRTTVDQQIMSGPNRARGADANPSDSAHAPTTTTTTRGVDTTQTTTTARART
jgi:hypothetical protein